MKSFIADQSLALEQKAAALWRLENPMMSVFDCDGEMKEKYLAKVSDGWGRGMFIAGAVGGQSRGMPKEEEAWPILCCCGATIDDEAALHDHSCEYLPRPN